MMFSENIDGGRELSLSAFPEQIIRFKYLSDIYRAKARL